MKCLIGVAILLTTMTRPGIAQNVVNIFQFNYTFDSGAQLSGTFDGFVNSSGNPLTTGLINVLPDTAIATFNDFSGTTFTWDTQAVGVSSSQAGFIAEQEFAFVSFDGTTIDFALSDGAGSPTQLFLENGILSGQNNASTNNLLPTDFQEPFRPSAWSISVVPEPSSFFALGLTALACFARRRRI